MRLIEYRTYRSGVQWACGIGAAEFWLLYYDILIEHAPRSYGIFVRYAICNTCTGRVAPQPEMIHRFTSPVFLVLPSNYALETPRNYFQH